MSTSIVVAYPFSAEELALRVADLKERNFLTPAAYREGTNAIAVCRQMRVQIEERRKLLKHDSLEYGRKVDDVARQLTAVVEAVELPLKDAKKAVDEAKEAAKREALEAERRAVEEQIRAQREAEEAVLRVRRQAEEAALAEQRRALAAERAEAEKERQAELQRMALERAALAEERAAAAKELAEVRARKAAEEAERRAQELAEQKRAEEEEARINALEYEQARQKRLAALAPDREKLKTFRVCLSDLLRRVDEWRCADSLLEQDRQEAVDLVKSAVDVLTEASK